MLHLIFKSPIDTAFLERIAPGDTAVFIDAAVLGLLKKNFVATNLSKHCLDKHFFVLADDLLTRGINTSELAPGLQLIDYSQLVDLTVEINPIQSWY